MVKGGLNRRADSISNRTAEYGDYVVACA